MPDSDAVRQRRARLHRQGDHSACTDRCDALRPPQRHEVADAVRRYVAEVGIDDPDVELAGVLAIRAAEEVDAAATPGTQRALTDAIRSFRHWRATVT
jgi:hypothetical protein